MKQARRWIDTPEKDKPMRWSQFIGTLSPTHALQVCHAWRLGRRELQGGRRCDHLVLSHLLPLPGMRHAPTIVHETETPSIINLQA